MEDFEEIPPPEFVRMTSDEYAKPCPVCGVPAGMDCDLLIHSDNGDGSTLPWIN